MRYIQWKSGVVFDSGTFLQRCSAFHPIEGNPSLKGDTHCQTYRNSFRGCPPLSLFLRDIEHHHPILEIYHGQGCQFSDLSLISDFLRIKEACIKLIKYSQNMDKISIVSQGRLDSGKGLHYPSLNTVSLHLNQFRLFQTKFRLSE